MLVSAIKFNQPRVCFTSSVSKRNSDIKERPIFMSSGDEFVKQNYTVSEPKIKLNDINIICSDKTENQGIYIELFSRNDISKNNEAVDFLNKIIVNRKINNYEEDNYLKKRLYMYKNARELDLICQKNDLKTELINIKDTFLYPKVSDKELLEAKNMAKEIYILGTKTKNFPEDITNIDFGMPYNDFCSQIDRVSVKDILKYNDYVLKNSEVNLTTYINKEYYNKNNNLYNEINDIFENR